MDLCIAQSVGCDTQKVLGALLIGLIFVGVGVPSIVWCYWSAHVERKQIRRSRLMATPIAITRFPQASERRSQAIRIKNRPFPLRGIDRLLDLIFRGGSISGY